MPLQTLDLSYNKIRVIDKATMDVIDKLARKSKLMINLSNNDLQCDCQAIYFLQWMVKNEEYYKVLHFHYVQDLRCIPSQRNQYRTHNTK
jgi:hypothetical protein